MSTIHAIFTPHHVAQVPANDDPAVIVRFLRRNEEAADAAVILREADRPFTLSWVDRGGNEYGLSPEDRRRAEECLAQGLAVSLSKGQARRVRVYAEEVTELPLVR